MGQLVFLLGRSGTGKSYSMRNFSPEELAIVNVQGKILPFRGAGKIKSEYTDKSDKIERKLKDFVADGFKSIVVDDFQYVMANEFMRRAMERGYDKFTEIGRHAWDIVSLIRELPQDVIVYILCHIDKDDEGNEKIKTIGKLLDEKICLEGMSTIVLKTCVMDGVYSFLTQNNGKDTVKSPAGMFPSYAIDNDLKYVDNKIRNYYELGDFLTDEEMKEFDKTAAKADVIKGEVEGKKRRRVKSEVNSNEEEKAVRKRRTHENDEPSDVAEKPSDTAEESSEAVEEKLYFYDIDNDKYLAVEKGEKAPKGNLITATKEEYKRSLTVEDVSKRKRRRRGTEESEVTEEAKREEQQPEKEAETWTPGGGDKDDSTPEEEEKPRRRRRRRVDDITD